MASDQEIAESLNSFADACKENDMLTSMIRDWNRTLHIEATDLGSVFTLATNAGMVTASSAAIGSPDLVIQAEAELLTQIFYGEVSPNEPYNDGTLRIKGSEEDIVKLDFVIAMLWD